MLNEKFQMPRLIPKHKTNTLLKVHRTEGEGFGAKRADPYFFARSISRFPGGPGSRSTLSPTDCMARRTLPFAA